MAQSWWKAPLIALAIVFGLCGILAGGLALLNTPSAAPVPRGPVPGAGATLSSTAHTYMEAA
jgi:hypothetical protein